MMQIAAVIVAAGAFQALYGSAEYLSGHQHIFAYAKKHYVDEASGTFINRNHFAGFLAVTLPFALALVFEGVRRLAPARSVRERLVRLTEPSGVMLGAGALAAALIWTGVVLSYSRGGWPWPWSRRPSWPTRRSLAAARL